MASRGTKYTAKKVQQLIDQGYGFGEKENYKPFIGVLDFSSKGYATRLWGNKINRMYQFHSQLEMSFFFIVEWNESIDDVKEQFPLFDANKSLNEVMRIADELGIVYSKLKDEIYVMTTDFFIVQIVDGKPVIKIRTVKTSTDLEKERVVEKLRVEKEFFVRRNYDWGIVTEKDIDFDYVNNIRSLRPYKKLDKVGISNKEAYFIEDKLVKAYLEKELISKMKSMDSAYGFRSGVCLAVLKYLLANNYWSMDMHKKIFSIADYSNIEIKRRL